MTSTRTIELDPASDEAYFNRAVSTTKLGGSTDVLPGIIDDFGAVLQISENEDLIAQARSALETLLQNTDDPALQQQATEALGGEAAEPAAAEAVAEPAAKQATEAAGGRDLNRRSWISTSIAPPATPSASRDISTRAARGASSSWPRPATPWAPASRPNRS